MFQLIAGYVASLLLAASLIVSNDLKFRWLNTVGCLSFIVYGVLISGMPVILTNGMLLLINSYYLVKIYRKKEKFDLLEFEHGALLVARFINFYRQDISAYFPEFREIEKNNSIRFIVLRDMAIANIFAATLTENGTAVVNINYTVPKYRDYKVGRFIFEEEKKYLVSKSVKRLKYAQLVNKKHERFLSVMKFDRFPDRGSVSFIKSLE